MGKKNKYAKAQPEAAAPPQQQQQQQQAAAAPSSSASGAGAVSPTEQPQRSVVQPASGGGWQTSGTQQQRQGQQGGWGNTGQQQRQAPPGGQQRGPPPGQQSGYPQQGQQGGQYRGPPGGQQRGPPPGQQSGYPQQRQQGGQYRGPPEGQQRGPPSGQQSGYPQQVQQGGQYRGPPGGQQRGPPGGQQRGPPPGQQQGQGTIKRGTLGRPGTVCVNYLDVDMSKMPDIAYHYDVALVPERPKKFYRNAFELFRVKYLNDEKVAYDGGKSCYSVGKLSNVTGEVQVVDKHGRTLNYKITVKETENSLVELKSLRSYMNDKIYEKPMRAMQCLEVVLAAPCSLRSIRAGRSFFKNSDQGGRRDLGDGYEALVGLYQAFVLGDKPFVNVDVSHKSFPIALPMIEYMEKFGLQMRITPTTAITNSRFIVPFIRGINIVYEPPKSFGAAPRVYKVNGLSEQPACTQKFKIEDKVMTVQEYFRSRNYEIKFPKLLCMHVGPPAKNIYLPMELCRIEEGQALNRKDGASQVSEMIKFAATSTHERKAKIMDLLRYFNHNADPTISRFGIHIAGDFITVNTRLLPPPQVEYKNGRFQSPMNGSWRSDRCQFLVTKQKAHKWAILNCDARMPYNKAAEFEDLVKRQSSNVNICLEPKAEIRTFRDDRNLDEHFKDLKAKQYDLVFVVIPSRGATYEVIKQKAELQYGILTQCIKQNNFERRLNPQLVDNVLLKVNSKLNGINHKLKDDAGIALANVMYLGADVTHPSPDQREIPSIVGVAASHDLYGANYNMQYRLQVGGGGGVREEIVDMESITIEHLRVYYQYQKRYPAHIIYYRDGVSDGQFPIIKNVELNAIQRACAKTKISPKLCCVIVVKRHHTRFFPKGQPHPRNKFNNVDPGTIVDRTIVHPNEMQFFMVSHQSIQGTAKPTRYNVIENTGNLDIDLLQQLTYNLCHMFPRCNRSVSYPAPAYLAHLAAARGRVYINGARLYRSLEEEYKKRLIVPEFLKTNPMYFV